MVRLETPGKRAASKQTDCIWYRWQALAVGQTLAANQGPQFASMSGGTREIAGETRLLGTANRTRKCRRG